MPITRTPMVDDDGSGTTGTIINNAWKQEFYNQIDAALTASGGLTTGTWTPTISGDGGGSGQVYALQAGVWVKAGANFVLATGYIALSTKGTITGNVVIGGWPFPFPNNAVYYSPVLVNFASGLATAWASLAGLATGGASVCSLRGMAGAGGNNGHVQLSGADITNTTGLSVQASYQL